MKTNKPHLTIPLQEFPRGRVPPKWHWHYRILNHLRNQLVRDQGAHLKEIAEPIERNGMVVDSATDEFVRSMAAQRLSVERNALYEVEAALRRIESGTYGKCEQSGRPIESARLRALPWTRYRMEFASKPTTKKGERRERACTIPGQNRHGRRAASKA